MIPIVSYSHYYWVGRPPKVCSKPASKALRHEFAGEFCGLMGYLQNAPVECTVFILGL